MYMSCFCFFQTIEWVDPDVEVLWSAVWALQREVEQLKKKLKLKVYIRPGVVYLRPRKK